MHAFKGHPDNILVSWDVSVYEVSQEVAVASLFSSLKDPGHGFLIVLGVG